MGRPVGARCRPGLGNGPCGRILPSMTPAARPVGHRTGHLLGLVVALLCPPSHLRAQSECVPVPDGIETSPGPGATNVAIDAPVLVRFPTPVVSEPVAEDLVSVVRVGDSGGLDGGVAEPGDDPSRAIAGQLQAVGDHVVAFVPDELLAPNTEYSIAFREPGSGAVREAPFATGAETDQARPELFFGDVSVDVRSGEASSCGDEPGAFVVDLRFPPVAFDDKDLGALQYFLYLTRAEGLEAPRLLQRVRRQGSLDLLRFAFVLSPEEASGPVCVALRVVDAVGKVAAEQPELCFDPFVEAHFQSLCSARGPLGSRRAWAGGAVLPFSAAAAFLVALTLAVRRRGPALD